MVKKLRSLKMRCTDTKVIEGEPVKDEAATNKVRVIGGQSITATGLLQTRKKKPHGQLKSLGVGNDTDSNRHRMRERDDMGFLY